MHPQLTIEEVTVCGGAKDCCPADGLPIAVHNIHIRFYFLVIFSAEGVLSLHCIWQLLQLHWKKT